MIINSRKELKGLIGWYNRLTDKESCKCITKREAITKIYKNYKTTTFNED